MSSPAPKQVFISYASEDEECAGQICEQLEQRGIHCWIAPRDVVIGVSSYGEQIITAIESTSFLVIVLSAAANESRFVKNEVERAVTKGKAIIPIRIENLEPSRRLELFLAGSQWIDAWDTPLDEAVDRIADAIQTPTAPPPVRRRRILRRLLRSSALVPIIAVLALMGILGVAYYRWPRTVPHASPSSITVRAFENQRTDDRENDWFSKALQAAFSTELSRISKLSIVAPEIVDRVAEERGVDPMAAAQELGVGSMITGSFAVLDENLRIDARIVEISSGKYVAAENVRGNRSDFFNLQTELTLATLKHLEVEPTREEEAAAAPAKPSKAQLDRYKMLLEAEGVTRSSGSAEPARDGGSDRHSRLGPDPAKDAFWNVLVGPAAVAHAQEPSTSDVEAVRMILEEYRRAYEAGDLNRLASLYVAFPDSQREAMQAYLGATRDLRVELADVVIERHRDEFAVSYTRRDQFVDRETGEPLSLEVRLTKFMVHRGDGWRFAEEKGG